MKSADKKKSEDFYKLFKPQLTPQKMLEMGVFGGSYFSSKINEYLGELYVETGRIELAKERLQTLNDCKCEEYEELKELIEKN